MIIRAYESSKPRWSKERHERREPDASDGDRGVEIVCARCGQRITDAGERTERSGLHVHSQINPHGFIWEFGCWRSAPGCAATGEPTSEFSWFAGYRWQIGSCRGCDLHLGWLFAGDSDRFWGLIVDRLVERDACD
jgi:hypothetical protein